MGRPPEEHDAEVERGREGAEPEGEDQPGWDPAPVRGGRGRPERGETEEDEAQGPEQVRPASEPVVVPEADPEVPPVRESEGQEPRRQRSGEGGAPDRRERHQAQEEERRVEGGPRGQRQDRPQAVRPATRSPKKKYQITTPTESMMLRASRKVRSVILLVVLLTRSVMAHSSEV